MQNIFVGMDPNLSGHQPSQSRMNSESQFDQRMNTQMMTPAGMAPQTQAHRNLRAGMQQQFQSMNNVNDSANKNSVLEKKQQTQFKIIPTVVPGTSQNNIPLQNLAAAKLQLQQQLQMPQRQSSLTSGQVADVHDNFRNESDSQVPQLQLQNQPQLHNHQLQQQQFLRQQQQLLLQQQQQQQMQQMQQMQQVQQLQMQQSNTPMAPQMITATSKSSPNKQGPEQTASATAANAKAALANTASVQASQIEANLKIFKRNLGNAAISRVLDLIDMIVNEQPEHLATYEYWQNICQTYAMPNAAMRITVPTNPIKTEDEEQTTNTKLYMLSVNTAPRFFLANVIAKNVVKNQLTLPGLRFHVMTSGYVFMASRISMIYTYKDGSSTHLTGVCRLMMSRDFRMELIDCNITCHVSQVSLLQLEKKWLSSISKNEGKEREFMKRLFNDTLSKTSADDCGFEEGAMRVLKISDVMTQLRPLMAFTMANNLNSPIKSLETYVNANHTNNLQRSVGGSAPTSSPAAQTMSMELKGPMKKRRTSTAINSPLNSESR